MRRPGELQVVGTDVRKLLHPRAGIVEKKEECIVAATGRGGLVGRGLRFLAARARRPVVRLEVKDIDVAAVRDFLHHLEAHRGNGISTRNNRLAAIRSFFGFAAAEEPLISDHCKRICALPLKRAPVRPIPYLEQDEMRAISGSCLAVAGPP